LFPQYPAMTYIPVLLCRVM